MSEEKPLDYSSGLMGLEVAVIGMAGRFPGARDVGEFWENIKNGVEGIWFFSQEELDHSGVNAKLSKHPDYVKAYGLLEGIEYYDSDFFGYNPREADIMDPQMRLFHEIAWAALEDAGYSPGSYPGSIGFYAGATSSLKWTAALQLSGKIDEFGEFASFQLMDRDFLSMRISYSLNLRGPAILLQTACSTSLTAVHQASQAILMGECDMALAGGVTVVRLQKEGYLYQQGLIHSPDGHCRAFDNRAGGTMGGDGAGIVVLKRLENAAADNDHIYAVVKGFAINNDGLRKIGFTAPSIEGQAEAIIAAQAMAEVPPESITYVETHGTGTEIGDPIEIEALKLAFNTDKKEFCALGSVKTNVGHLDIAAGITGFIKTVLSVHHRMLPPSLHQEILNPKIDLKDSPFYVNTGLKEWKHEKWPLRAGVSSFGIGGSNAHIILEEAPKPVIGENRKEQQYQLILFSAKTKDALDKMTKNLVKYFKKNLLNHGNHENPINPGPTLVDAAYTLQVGRDRFKHKKMLVCSTTVEAIEILSTSGHERIFSFSSAQENPQVVFLFPGQGSQYVDMGRGLYETEPLFREELDRCFEILNPLIGCDIKEILYPVSSSHETKESYISPKIDQTEITQPLLFTLEYALARLLLVWGITPHALMGHSIGEYVAACLSGVFSLETAIEVVVLRGKLMAQVQSGSMLSISLPEKQLLPLLEDHPAVSLAAVNSSSLCTVSGPHEAIKAFEQHLKLMSGENGTGCECQRLHTSHAFHSRMMDPVLREFEAFLGNTRINPPQIPYISNLTGTWIRGEEVADPAYWSTHLRQTVRFAYGLEKLFKNNNTVFIEVGPGKALGTFIRKHNHKGPGYLVLNLLRHPRENVPDDCFFLTQIGRLWLYNISIDWQTFHARGKGKRQRISLPTYPFRGLRYQLPGPGASILRGKAQEKPGRPTTLLEEEKLNIDDWFYVPSWKPSPVPGHESEDIKHPKKSKWLMLTNEVNLGDQLAKALQEAGQEVTIVRKGQAFTQLGDDEYVINMKLDSDYRQLFAQLRTARRMPHRIIHLWNVTENTLPMEEVTEKEIEDALALGFYSLLSIAREIGKQGVGDGADDEEKVEIAVLTNRMQRVTGEEVPEPLKAVVRGAVQVIPGEYSNINCRSIDIDAHLPTADSPGEAELTGHLLAEVISDAPVMYAAYRGGQRWEQTFEKTSLETTGEETPLLRENGVYLITGGLGGIGLVLAAYLAGSFMARLVLIGRSLLPAREKWENWLLAHDPADETSGKIRKIQQLETAGAEVLVLRADAASQHDMQVAVETAENKFGPVNGIIHAAGLPDGGLIQHRTREMSDAVFVPKIKAAIVLDNILSSGTRKKQLDFIMLCSSLNSVLAPPGQAAYCAANAFLDTLALTPMRIGLSAHSPYIVSINWDAWQEVGMSVKAAMSSSPPPRQRLIVHHPLFNSREVYGPDHEVFVSNFRVDTHWVLAEHRIMGTATLPGTAYLEMARAAFAAHIPQKTIELKDVYFLTPLTIKDNEEKEVRTTIRKMKANDRYTFSTESRVKPGKDKWVEHCRGNVLFHENHLQPRQYQIEKIKSRFQEQEITYHFQGDSFNQGTMTFGPRWNNLKKVNPGKDQALGFLELPEPFASDTASYGLHPALLDMATILLKRVQEDDESHLPFYYKKIRINNALPGKIVCLARLAGNGSRQPDTRSYDITIMDQHGNELVEIEEYTLKKVKESDQPLEHPSVLDLAGEQNITLEISSPGSLDHLEFRPTPRRSPGPGEVEIAVYAVGLNFKEVLLALGALGPVEPGLTFGLECSGKITARGEGVENLELGDEVIAFGSSCFGSYITTPVSLVSPKPANLSFEAAATIPVAFMTAYYALIRMARLSRGERVLIHSAAGGVGMAAVKIAQWKGAQIFATAGSEEKRTYLKSLGIKHVMDSRTLNFAQQVMEYTGGKGVNVVLNSLSGEFIHKSISLLAPYGRFLEIGIRDMINNTQLGLQPFLKGLSYFSVTLDPDLPDIAAVWQEVVRHFNEGILTPLPYKVFHMEEVARAFEYMSTGTHIGKIVVVHQDRLEELLGEALTDHQKEVFKYGILPTEGIEVFRKILANRTFPQVVISTTDFFNRIKKFRLLPGDFLERELEHLDSPIPNKNRPQLSTPYTPPGNKTQQILAHIWQESLGIKEVGIHDDFFEIGGDSLKVITITSKIHKTMQVEIPVNEFFNRPTIKKLSEFIQTAGDQTFAPIEPVEKKEYYPLSSSQKRLFILQQMETDFVGYNETERLILHGKIDKEKFDRTFTGLIKRHESLRTSFEMMDKEPVQRIHDKVEFGIQYDDLALENTEKKNYKLQITKREETAGHYSLFINHHSFIRPFDLSRAPLLRVGVKKLEEEKYLFMIDAHHIITDGISQALLLQDFITLYADRELAGLRIQYKDYSEWQSKEKETGTSRKQENYWLGQLAGEIPVLNLPIDYPRPRVQSFQGNTIHFEIDQDETGALKSLALKEEVTLFMLLLSLYYILLSKLCQQEDIIVGTPIAARRREDFRQIIGMFVNTLVMRSFPLAGKHFTTFLQEVKQHTLKAYENQEYPFERLVEKVTADRNPGRNPLFDVAFALQNMDMIEIEIPGLKLKSYEYENKVAKFDFALIGVEKQGRLDFEVEYCSKLFKEETISKFINFFKRIVSTIIKEPDKKIAKISIIPDDEKNRILYEFNDTHSDFPMDKTIHQLFAEQVQQTPDKIALIGTGHPEHQSGKGTRFIASESRKHQIHLTYQQLNKESNRLSHLLKVQGIKTGAIVAVIVERSLDMIISLLGILKTGGSYLPIDADYPKKRINNMLKDSGVGVLVTTPKLQVKVKAVVKENSRQPQQLPLQLIHIDTQLASAFEPPLSTLTLTSTCQLSPANLAYIIYTSGSTGRPKGVLVSHQNVVRLVKNSNFIDFTANDRLLLTGAAAFDITTFEIWWPLLNGLLLDLKEQEVILDGEKLKNVVTRDKISILHLTPQLFDQLAAQCLEIFSWLKYFLVGGDLVSPRYVNLLRNTYKHVKILHMYGPTENTTFSTFFPVNNLHETTIPIGKPISNSTVYILDKHGNLQPIGVAGELCTGGDGVARGYLNKPELTAEKFDHDLKKKERQKINKKLLREVQEGGFLEKSPPGRRGQKIYKTGDMARWLPDGNIEFFGRIDQQIKIRGFRIELGEIENQLMTHPHIKKTVVVSKKDENNEKFLCAYFISANTVTTSQLRTHLSKSLPDYMIPSYFIQLEQIPLSPTGKVDRNLLPVPELHTGENYTAPRDETEKQLVKIWVQILGRDASKASQSHVSQFHESIGIRDNFFELGGHSLKAAIMAAKIQKTFSTRIPLAEIFANPTIERLAQSVKQAAAVKYASIEPVERREYYELSSAQKRLYILQQMEPTITAYHITVAFKLEGAPDIPKLERALKKLVQRHESFRTSFELKEIVPVQRIHNEVKFKIDCYGLDNSKQSGGKREEVPLWIENFVRPFDLSRAPLLRVGLMKLPYTPTALRGHPSQEEREYKYILMVDMHHIIADGSSMGVFIKDLMIFYRRETLPGLRIHYRDYSHWYNQAKHGEVINRQETYWLNQLVGEIPALNLPLDYERLPVQSFEGKTLYFDIREEDTASLKSLALKEEITLFMLLLAITNVWLTKLSGQEEIIVGIPVAARRHADLEEIIGMFVNTLVLWNKPGGNKPFNTFVKEVKEKTLSAYENQEYPFEDLVEKVSAPRDTSRNPLFDVIFALQNMETNEIEIPALTFKPHRYESKTAKFDLTIIGFGTGNKLLFTIEYCSKLFKEETILRFITYFKNLVSSIIHYWKREISWISFIPEEEKQQLLYQFNDTQSREPPNKSLHELFREHAERTPDYIAVVGTSRLKYRPNMTHLTSITYCELNNKSNQLAYLLIEKGVKPDTIVAIMMQRSIEMIIAIIGILKAGGAYLPIDPEYPEERINFMLKDSGVGVLVTTLKLRVKAEVKDNSRQPQRIPLQLIHIDTQLASTFEPPLSALTLTSSCQVSPANLAYIIYTSGTTGKPKGNLTTHANVIRVVKNTNYCELTPNDRILQLSNYAFDGSVFDIYGALLNGSALVLVDRDRVLAVDQLAALIIRQQISVFFITTALFNTLIDMQLHCFADIRKVLFGGERVSLEHTGKALEYMGKGRIIHVYGPTETTVYATYYFIDRIAEEAVTIPIGLPITDTTAYILDKYLQFAPISITGELYIGGEGLARGYLNQPNLTAEKFLIINDKLKTKNEINQKFLQGGPRGTVFSKRVPPGRRRLYKTGDLVRRLVDGNIEFIGRIDGQIKIRGFRVELGEIEKRLINHGQIQEAAVIARELGKGNHQLVAYIVPQSASTVLSDGLRKYLSGFLPGYMIPSYFVELDKLPLNPNGKVDLKLLPIPGTFKSYSGESYAAPATDMEKLIADIWKEMLKLEKVGIDDNFFDIGGNSLNILQVNKKLNAVLERSLPVMTMFRYTTIRSLAEFLGEQETKDGLDRKKRAEALTRGKSDRLKRYRKSEQRNRRIALKM